MTKTWSPNELEAIGAAKGLSVAPRRPDGTLRPYTTIWVVRVGDELYVRSYRDPSGSWYRAAVSADTGRIRAGGVERHVSFEQANAVEPAGSTTPTGPNTAGRPLSTPWSARTRQPRRCG
jgi:hypothetical protein